MKKLLLPVLLLLMLATGCGNDKQPSGGQEAAPAKQPAAQPATAEEKLNELKKLPAAERQAKLEAEAAKEGKVIMYGAYSLGEAEPLLKAFMEKYPQVKVEYLRASTAPLLDKILSEASVGKMGGDIANIGLEVLYEVDNLIMPYQSPETKGYASEFYEPSGRWVAMYHDPKPIAYNTQRIKSEEAPRSWEDLADPRWKGKLGMPASDGADWANVMLKTMGKEKGMAYLQKMAAQEIRLEKSNSGLAQLVAAGDLDMAFYVNNAAVEIAKGKGGPIAAINPDPLVTAIQVLVMFKENAHPYASALLIDWISSKEGQEKIRAINPRFGGRKDIQYSGLSGSRLWLIGSEQVDKAQMEEASKIFENLFVKKIQ